jgi:hypothetical protein
METLSCTQDNFRTWHWATLNYDLVVPWNRMSGAAEKSSNVKLPLFLILLAITAESAAALICVLCATQPHKVAAYIRERHLRSPTWARKWPFAGYVMRDWYPAYLRIAGIGGFVFALIWLALVIQEIFK